jgi:hypothetical protein
LQCIEAAPCESGFSFGAPGCPHRRIGRRRNEVFLREEGVLDGTGSKKPLQDHGVKISFFSRVLQYGRFLVCRVAPHCFLASIFSGSLFVNPAGPVANWRASFLRLSRLKPQQAAHPACSPKHRLTGLSIRGPAAR